MEVAGGEGVAVTAVTEEGAVGFLRSGKKKEERRRTKHGGMVPKLGGRPEVGRHR